MEGFGPETYGERNAAVYDQFHRASSAADDAAAFLAELADGGPALELAIGTGRVALPLAALGVSVEGIDISIPMVEQLRAKPGGKHQLECFANVARHLEPGGTFVIEAFVPDLTRFRNNSNVSAVAVETETVRLDVSRHDPVAQRVDATHIHIGAAGVQLYPVSLRYAWPSELDLMARLAGLLLRERWDNWHRHPYTTTSPMAVSVYSR